MTDIHDDFLKEAKRILRNGSGDVEYLARALEKQYRDGFKAGQRDEEAYQRQQSN